MVTPEIEKIFIDEFGDKIQVNKLLREVITIGVGGIADLFSVSKSIDELVAASTLAYENNIPLIVLGWGSNVVVSDFGFAGLVIQNQSNNIVLNRDKGEIIADSGISLAKLLNVAASEDLGGLEFLAGVPGTLGGAVYNNSGSTIQGVGEYVKGVTVFEERSKSLRVIRHTPKWMNFSYRNSKLKSDYREEDRFKPVILTVRLQMTHKRKDEILRQIKDNLAGKFKNQPLGEKSAGSFFKNPGTIRERTAGYLLDRSQVKKLKIGGAAVSKKHANFIINRKNASASDIRTLADNVRQRVKESYNIELEEEVEYIGKW